MQNSINRENLAVSQNDVRLIEAASEISFMSDAFALSVYQHDDSCMHIDLDFPVSSVARAINSEFIISSARAAIATYSFQLTARTTVGGGQTARIDGRIRPTPGDAYTLAATVQGGISGALILGIALTNNSIYNMTLFVPVGYQVKLEKTGSGDATYIAGQEILL